MTRIPTHERDIIEQEIYLPMLIKILERDRLIIEKAPFKFNNPYLELVEQAIKLVQKDLKVTKDHLRKQKTKVSEVKRDSDFTMYSFIYNGYEEFHNYFNPRLRNRCEELLRIYIWRQKNKPLSK
ncbi:hypothetical protein [Peribacillus muralis]|uniref:hypothetical protein n=1 Tax=Peribacillus muralis TaxID=264697 RepID=UPI003D000AFB